MIGIFSVYMYIDNFFLHTVTECGALSDIPNGAVSYTSSQVGAQARYTCDTGYHRDGVEVRICLDNGQWSADAPSCVQIQGKSDKLVTHD